MIVYVVIGWYRAEADVLAVFSDLEKANRFVEQSRLDQISHNIKMGYEIESHIVDAEHEEQS